MFRSVSRLELTATNGNTLRFDVNAEGDLKVNARKGDHNQSVSVIPSGDVAALVVWLTLGNTVPDAQAQESSTPKRTSGQA